MDDVEFLAAARRVHERHKAAAEVAEAKRLASGGIDWVPAFEARQRERTAQRIIEALTS